MKKITGKKKWLIISAVIVILCIWIIWSNITVRLTNIKITSSDLPAAFDGFTIAQVSDLHNAEFGDDNSVLIEMLRSASPDIIAITGDIIDSEHTDIDIAIRFITNIVDIAPCYYVTGNHEAWLGEDYSVLEDAMTDAGVTVLHDETIKLERDGQTIQLIGLDDPDFSDDAYRYSSNEEMVLAKLENIEISEDFVILLSHRPEVFDAYADSDVDLVLSGHAHGGQLRIPFVGGLIAPDQGFFPEYDSGVYSEDETSMVVSRGIGNSVIPVRINNRPEMVIVELHN